MSIAGGNSVGLIVKGTIDGIGRGFVFQGGVFRSDRADEPTRTAAALLALATTGGELTYTVVPAGSQLRLGIDRDLDGFLDRDEMDAGTDPADSASIPGVCVADISPAIPDGLVNGADLAVLLSAWGTPGLTDLDGSGSTEAADLALLLGAWGACNER